MTQNERILNHLREFGTITPLKALEEYGIMRLASRINELRDLGETQGFRIETTMIQRENRFGEKVSFAEYKLIEGEAVL